jgi:dienelactone hydrolase
VEVTYDADGRTMTGHLARPAGDGPWPAVLLAHDGIGLDDTQRGFADDLAARGYLVFALDYHGGRTYVGEPAAMLDRVLPLLADPGRLRAVGRAGLDVLLAQPGADPDRLAAVGLGAGGSVVLELLRSGVPFRAVAAIHPGLPVAGDWPGVDAAVLLATGSADPICTVDRVLAFGAVLAAAGADWTALVLGGAQHAFWAAPDAVAGPTVPGVGAHPVAAARTWRAVLDLLGDALSAPPRRAGG